MLTAQLLAALACVWAPVVSSVTIYSTKTAKVIATSDAYAAVATLAAYDQTVLTSPAVPSPAITTNFLVQVSSVPQICAEAEAYRQNRSSILATWMVCPSSKSSSRTLDPAA